MKKIKLVIIGVLFLAINMACSTADVQRDYDRNVDFSKYKTFHFYENLKWGTLSKLDQKRMLNSIESELTAKGLTKSETPDLLIDIQAEEKQIEQTNSSVGIGGGSGGRGVGVGVSVAIPIKSKKRSEKYVIEMVDSSNNQMVWQGIYNNVVSLKTDKSQSINQAIQKLLTEYPPQK